MNNVNRKQLVETLEMIEGLSALAAKCARTGQLSDMQKAIVGIIRGSEIAFEGLTGVKYHNNSQQVRPLGS